MWKYEVYADTGGSWRWRLVASNGQKVAASGESFASHSSATRAAEGFKAGAGAWNYEIYPDRALEYRWPAKSPNGQIVGASGEAFYSKSDAQRAADNVRREGGSAARP